MKRLITAVLLLAALASACGDGALPDDPDDGPESPVLTFHDVGGFVPVEFALSRGPLYVLTDHDRLISHGPVQAIFPGPLMPFYVAAELTSDDLQAVMELVERAGLPGVTDEVNDSMRSIVADAPTTVVTFRDDNGEHRFAVYALGIGEFDDPRITALEELLETVAGLSGSRESQPYDSDDIQVIAGPAAPTGDPSEVIEPWPLPQPASDLPAMFNEFGCRVYDSDDPGNPRDTLDTAHQMTLWQEGEQLYRLFARQLLPGEAGCQPLT